jgi:hypothetical protein
MQIDIRPLQYSFRDKPLLVGGKAMEYYGLRQAGADIDFVISARDYDQLAAVYPDRRKDLFGDLGVCINEFELWKCILLFDYTFLSRDALEEAAFIVIGLERLLFLKALAIAEPKYERDVRLIAQKIQAIQYGKDPRYPADFFAHT